MTGMDVMLVVGLILLIAAAVSFIATRKRPSAEEKPTESPVVPVSLVAPRAPPASDPHPIKIWVVSPSKTSLSGRCGKTDVILDITFAAPIFNGRLEWLRLLLKDNIIGGDGLEFAYVPLDPPPEAFPITTKRAGMQFTFLVRHERLGQPPLRPSASHVGKIIAGVSGREYQSEWIEINVR